MRKLIITSIVAALGTAAAAQPPVVVEAPRFPTERVSFGDLNLGTDQGVDRLKFRVRGAADRVCNSNSIEVLDTRLKAMRCYRSAVDIAYSDIARVVEMKRNGASLAATSLLVSAR